jgi:hypothetical protein
VLSLQPGQACDGADSLGDASTDKHTMNVTTESTDGVLTCCRLNEDRPPERTAKSGAAANFLRARSVAVCLECSRRNTARAARTFYHGRVHVICDSIPQTSLNDEHPLLLTDNGHLPMSDERGSVMNEVRFYPVSRRCDRPSGRSPAH